jgi:hypothetical protein
MNRLFLISIALFISVTTFGQRGSGLSYGVLGGLQFNSAILPDIKLNDDINSVLNGEDVVKGQAQWADLTFNYKFGGFVKHDHNFGFLALEMTYTTAKISQDIRFTTSDVLGNLDLNLVTLERDFSYLDFALSYNVYLSEKTVFTLGGTPSILLSNTGNQTPNKSDVRIFTGVGYNINDKLFISTRAELGLGEVYEGSYIHHLMIPISIYYTL